jgi:dihydrodipicolinate synthase/N-acetylneuraminate lyase
MRQKLPRGIVGVVQTPFLADGAIDEESLGRLVEAAIAAGVSGFVAPAVASEVESLTRPERERVVRLIAEASRGRVPLIVGGSSSEIEDCAAWAHTAATHGAAALLVAAPARVSGDPAGALNFFKSLAARVDVPLVVQDLEWNGPGLAIECLAELAAQVPNFAGIKIETVPAGPKYSQVRERLGKDFYIAGGWAVPQMIEALDRGVDALMPECSVLPVYVRIARLHGAGERETARDLFRELLPVLAYTNQEIRTSIAFFKELLVRKGIFRTAVLWGTPFAWDQYNRRIAEELIELYLALEGRVTLQQ